jgi:hypothetical protein
MMTHLRLSDGAILGTARTGLAPQEPAFDGNNIWIGNWGRDPDDRVMRLKPRDGRYTGSFSAGKAPLGMLFDGTSLWVAYWGSGTLGKITPAP